MADNDHGRKKRGWPPNDPPVFWVTLAAFFAVCLYTWYAREQVNKTQEANGIAKRALTEANKPYVLNDGFAPVRAIDNKGVLSTRIGINWRNWGNTPAAAARTRVCDPVIRHDQVEPSYTCVISERSSPETVIGPKQVKTIIGPDIKDSDLEATKDGSETIYIFGRLTYDDYIDINEDGSPKRRVTWFCDKIQASIPRLPFSPYTPVQSDLLSSPILSLGCPILNCSDDACRVQSLPKID